MRQLLKTVLALGLPVVLVTMVLVTVVLAQQRGGGMFGGGGMLINNASVQKEIKMTDDQVAKVKEMNEGLKDKRPQFTKDGNREELAEKMTAYNKEVEKGIAGILKPEQMKRFKQIQRQQMYVGAFRDPEVVAALKLTDDQKEQLKTLGEDVGKDLRELRQGAQKGDFAEIGKKTAALNKEAMQKASAMLTAEQKNAWKEIVGEPFEMKMEFGNFGKGERRKKNP